MEAERRDILKLAAVVVAGVSSFGQARAETAHATPVPADVGRKFFANGRVRPFAGNTIICHVPQQGEDSAYFNALLDIYRDASVLPFAHKIALTPPSSFHMTIFGGANDQDRKPDQWPQGLPLDMDITACNDQLAERLKAFKLHCELPIRMKVDPEPPVEAPLVLRLLPVDDAENAKLLTLITRLSQCLGIFPSKIAQYRFHTTLGYSLQWLSAEEDREFQSLMRKWRKAVADTAPEIRLGAPEYCLFEDMFAFHRQFYLT